jgi:anti-sigma regulatory factor (Ser/Thr protein kinase)
VLERANELLVPEMPEKMFVTCFYGVLDPVGGRFRFANAGHDLPYRTCVDGTVDELRARGMPLGLMPQMTYEEKEIVIEPEQTILFSSDGLIEAHAPDGEMFGCPRTKELIAGHPGGAELIDHLLTELHRFTGPGWIQEDDITMVTLRRTTGAGGCEEDEVRELLDIAIPSREGNERRAMERVAEAVSTLGLEESRLERLKTAVAEATMNAIEHGNENRPELDVHLRMTLEDATLRVFITDHGGGKEIPESTEPSLEAKLAGEQSPRGWGLFLIKNMVDDMRVSSDDTHHTIELIVRLDAPGKELES